MERQPPKTGMLKKYSPALLKRWQPREVEVKDCVFKYFKDEKGKREAAGTLNFDLYQCQVAQDARKK